MTKKIRNITDPIFINATIVALNQDIIRILEKTNCNFKAQIADDCNYRIEEAKKKQLNFSDMIDSLVDHEEILNDLGGRYA
jgi:hypothetical protein